MAHYDADVEREETIKSARAANVYLSVSLSLLASTVILPGEIPALYGHTPGAGTINAHTPPTTETPGGQTHEC